VLAKTGLNLHRPTRVMDTPPPMGPAVGAMSYSRGGVLQPATRVVGNKRLK
jgi:hypothetical protein